MTRDEHGRRLIDEVTEADPRPIPVWEADSLTRSRSQSRYPYRILVDESKTLNKNKAVQSITDIVYCFSDVTGKALVSVLERVFVSLV